MKLRAAEQHVLVVVGEADMATADQLRSQVADALSGSPPSLVVDLVGLDFCDHSGLDALRDAARQARAAGVPLTVRGMSRQLAWLHATFPPVDADVLWPQPPDPPMSEAGVATAAAAGIESYRDASTSDDAPGAAPPDPGTAASGLPLHTALLPVDPHREGRQPDDVSS